MCEAFKRTKLLIGDQAFSRLKESKVIIFGIGGVGSYTAEALARSGVENLGLVDYDDIETSNLNRQIHATVSTIGLKKVQAMEERLLSINPNMLIKTYPIKYSKDLEGMIDLSEYDYIVDAIDMVSSKIYLIERAKELNIDIISAMGAGNKLDPTRFKVVDIYKTSQCPLARVMRRELRKRDIKDLKVVWSDEEPIRLKTAGRDTPPGTISFVPSVAGLILAGEVLKDLMKEA